MTIDERMNFFIKRSKRSFTTKEVESVRDCMLLFPSTYNKYINIFIKHNLLHWKQRMIRLNNTSKAITKYRLFLLYGKKEGVKRFEDYCHKQSISNTYEYKREKYNWTEQQFFEYNKRRSTTLDNMTQRYGESIGREKFESYRKLQKRAGCEKEYFIEKYGANKGKEIYEEVCSKKALTLENYIQRHGLYEGKNRFEEYINKRKPYYSKSSQDLFREIETENCYYAEKNKEFGYMIDDKYYFYDFVDTTLKKCIEYNGDWIHCNPCVYSEDYVHPYGYTAKEKWKFDEKKVDALEKKGYTVLIIWESDYLKDKELVIENTKKFLRGNV
jgi:hypothetical protein